MRHYLKKTIDLLAFLAVLPAFLLYRLAAAWPGKGTGVSGVVAVFQLVSGHQRCLPAPGLLPAGAGRLRPGRLPRVRDHLRAPGARVGRGVYVGAFCCLGEIVLEDDVLLASHVSVMNGPRQHGIERLDIPIRKQPGVPAARDNRRG